MTTISPLDVQLHPELRKAVSAFMSIVQVPEATPCFVKSRTHGEPEEECWNLGAFFPEDLAEIESEGRPVLYTVEDLVVAIPQKAEELVGKLIGWDSDRLVVTSRAP